MKYKVGDRVRIVSETTEEMDWNDKMDTYLGKVMTIKNITDSLIFWYRYKMVEDDDKYYWGDEMIVGLASETPFDFDAWKYKKVCMHCKTEEEAEDFCREMDRAGLRWSSGTSYLGMSCFNAYKDLTCYYFNEGAYDNTMRAKKRGDQILEWSDYRSTEPPKEEQEKTMEPKSDDKPLNFKEAMAIRKRMCETMDYKCENCCIAATAAACNDFFMNYVDEAEVTLKEWAAEHPVKTNEQKCNEMFLEVFGMQYATALKKHSDWWQEEYIEPNKEQE